MKRLQLTKNAQAEGCRMTSDMQVKHKSVLNKFPTFLKLRCDFDCQAPND